MLKIVTKLLLKVLIVCRSLVFKNIVAVLIIELICLLGLPKTLGILQVVTKLLQLKKE